jgi:plasmid maintenance system killer protein
MKICFYNKSIEDLFENDKKLQKKYGINVAENIRKIDDILENAETIRELNDPAFVKYRFHELKGDRKYQWAFVIVHTSGLRIIVFLLDLDKKIIRDISKEKCVYVQIKEIGDYHD